MVTWKFLAKRFMALSNKTLGKRRVATIRQMAFRTYHRLHGLPHLRKDFLIQLDDTHVLINCRLLDPNSEVTDILIRYADGKTQSISNNLVHYKTSSTSLSSTLLPSQAPDRFTGKIRCEADPATIEGVVLAHGNGNLRTVKTSPRPIPVDPMPTIRKVLELLPVSNDDKRRIFDHGVGAMIGSAWDNRSKGDSDGTIVVYNPDKINTSPAVSIIVPIYGRYDFIEYQLALFANDPDMQAHEILYVIDDPALRDEVRHCCDSISRIYPIAFSVLYLNSNLGFAGATNSGARHSTAPAILLLNSDVFPTRAGWLTQMLDCTGDETDNLILGARLLYEDETIQHDGMTFHASPFVSHLWTNLHPGKGLPAELFAANTKPCERECVTGACLLISRKSFTQLGGLDENYILGDFEDSDLCMKAREHGMSIAIAEHVSLYHLERQSQSLVSGNRWKSELTYYNCWYHTQKWDSQIKQVKQAA